MADIRQNATGVDTFDGRTPEVPLAGGWTGFSGVFMEVQGTPGYATEPAAGGSGRSYWTPDSWDGDDAEAWAWQWSGGTSGIAWRIYLMYVDGGGVQGYRFSHEVGAVNSFWKLNRITNNTQTEIASLGPFTNDPEFVNGGGIFLIRRNGSDVEGWACSRADVNTWTKFVSATDTAHTTGLHIGLGWDDNSNGQIGGWRFPGGGPQPKDLPAFIRRPWEYQGKPLEL